MGALCPDRLRRALDRGLNRLIYTRHFLATLRPKSLAKLEKFPGIYDAAAVRAARTFREFDNVVTAPLHGFRDVDHYWSEAASGPWLARIRVPTLLLNARNDPFLPEHALLALAGRVRYEAVADEDALAALAECCAAEGILPAIESAHALAGARRWANAHPGATVLVCLSGRGDKDLKTLEATLLAGTPA